MEQAAEKDSKLKSYLVNYTSVNTDTEYDKVKVESIIESITKEFPELVLAIAEENWIRGYHQALVDVETTEAEFEKQLDEED